MRIRLNSPDNPFDDFDQLLTRWPIEDLSHRIDYTINVDLVPDEVATQLAGVLKQGRCPNGTKIVLNDESDESPEYFEIWITELSDALRSGKCPTDLKITFFRSPVEEETIVDLMTALSSGHCPIGLGLDFYCEKISEATFTKIADSLSSGRCPPRLKLTIGCFETDIGCIKLFEALKSGSCPEGLELKIIEFYGFGTEILTKIAEALEFGRCPSKLTLDISKIEDIGGVGAARLAKALESKNCPSELKLILSNGKMGKQGLTEFAKALGSGNCKDKLELEILGSFFSNLMNDKGVSEIAEALNTGSCPKLQIGLDRNYSKQRTDYSVLEKLAAALSSGRCPPGLELQLPMQWYVDDAQIAIQFARPLKAGKCPKGLKLDLHYNQIGFLGVKALADALSSGACPKDLCLDLSINSLGKKEILLLAAALMTGNCPAGLELRLWSFRSHSTDLTALDDNVAVILATALESGACPPNLTLDLRVNCIYDFGAHALAQSLKTGLWPFGLKLNIGFNIHLAGILLEALKTTDCHVELQMEPDENDRDPELKAIENINKALIKNNKRQVALSCIAFRQNTRSPHSFFRKLPDAIIDSIFDFVLPASSKPKSLLFKKQIKNAAWPKKENSVLKEDGTESDVKGKKIRIM